MSAVAEGSLAFSLLNDFQHGFPLCAQPFVRVAHAVGSTEDAVLATYGQLHQSGCLSRIGAVFAPRRMGASILAALSVPPEQLDAVAAVVSQFAEVNHNYEREHRFDDLFAPLQRTIGRGTGRHRILLRLAGVAAAARRAVSY